MGILTLVLQLLSILWATPVHARAPQQTIVAHVFIHGTRLPGFIFLDPRATFGHTVSKDSVYVRILSRIRAYEYFTTYQPLLELGIQEVTSDQLTAWREQTLSPSLFKRAAIHIIGAYDSFLPSQPYTTNKYYTYGWIGVLDDAFRRNDAKQLYEALCSLRSSLQKQYHTHDVHFVLHGHSHGGNVILYLPRFEHKYHNNLVIDHTFLYGTPIQPETASYAKDPLFKTIYNLYSEGDHVQIGDRFSTESKKSYRRISDIVDISNTPNTIYELCVCAEKKSTAFCHASFFYTNAHQITRIRRGIKPFHRVLDTLTPLPIVSFSPILMSVVSRMPNHAHHQVMPACITCSNDQCIFTVGNDRVYAQSDNVLPLLTHIKQHIYCARRHSKG